MLSGDRFDGIDFRQHFAGDADDLLPGRRHLGKCLPAAGKDLNAQLILQHADLLTDTRLGGIEPFGGG
ncbi:Uncharacterised protein [Klebsiella pneumoniae]|uniref:Uncharacterized protein n=1 Tax=Klebsiella pneumoniae TaxID=573 RepID=A0A4P0Y414_KLEPN|nr:Uncharacterised protein [Klebsiella pneumoniae]